MSAVPILLYHAIDDAVDRRFRDWAVTPALFEEHLDLLSAAGYTTLTVSDYVDRALDGRGPLPRSPLLITFDDGFADFHAHAVPRLAARSMTATIFVTTGCVGGTSRWLARLGEGARPMMSWEQVAGLADAGIECGGHSHTHRELDTLRQSSVAREVQASRDALRDAIGEVRTFAYPHGHHSQRVVRAVRDAGYESACAVGDQLLRPPGDRWALSRLVVRGGMTAVDLERALSPPRLRGTSGRARRAGWRIVRRARAVRAR